VGQPQTNTTQQQQKRFQQKVVNINKVLLQRVFSEVFFFLLILILILIKIFTQKSFCLNAIVRRERLFCLAQDVP
jgi:hypothetical protein